MDNLNLLQSFSSFDPAKNHVLSCRLLLKGFILRVNEITQTEELSPNDLLAIANLAHFAGYHCDERKDRISATGFFKIARSLRGLVGVKSLGKLFPLDTKGNNGDNLPELTSAQVSNSFIKEALRIVKAPYSIQDCGQWALPISVCDRHSIGIIRTIKECDDGNDIVSHRFNASHVGHCGNVWLCGSCRSFIMRGRCREVSKAYDNWRAMGGRCYMLTLTVGHDRTSLASDMIPRFKSAYVSFRQDRAWKDMWNNLGGVDGKQSVICNWEFTFGESGVHPHRHILLFLAGDASSHSDRLLSGWVRIAAKYGFKVDRSAQDFQEITTAADYVSKIGFELTDSGYAKEGRASGRVNYLGLCRAVTMGEMWAIKQMADYIKAVHGLRALHWSKGMKAFLGVSESSDDELIIDETKRSERSSYVSRETFRILGDDKDYLLQALDDSPYGGSILTDFCYEKQIDLYDSKGAVWIGAGVDSNEIKRCIKNDARRDLALTETSTVTIEDSSARPDPAGAPPHRGTPGRA